MGWILFIIILVLIYIAYQLYNLNRSKDQGLKILNAENENDIIREQFPHLYNMGLTHGSKAVSNFLQEYPNHIWKFEEMKDLTESEEDQEKKKKMQAVVEDLKEGVVCLRKEREMTEYEVQFLVWVYLDRAYNGFPRSEINFNDFILLSNYNDAFPSKKN